MVGPQGRNSSHGMRKVRRLPQLPGGSKRLRRFLVPTRQVRPPTLVLSAFPCCFRTGTGTGKQAKARAALSPSLGGSLLVLARWAGCWRPAIASRGRVRPMRRRVGSLRSAALSCIWTLLKAVPSGGQDSAAPCMSIAAGTFLPGAAVCLPGRDHGPRQAVQGAPARCVPLAEGDGGASADAFDPWDLIDLPGSAVWRTMLA